MNSPKTLLEISGSSEKKLDWNKAALILIDFQREYSDGALQLGEQGREAIANAAKLLAYARKNNVPVFHVVHHAKPGSAIFDPTTDKASLIKDVEANTEEEIVTKSLPSSFYNTELSDLLSLTSRKQLVLAGFMSHMCVTATAIKALELGYENFVCADACASRDLKYIDGSLVKADSVHKAAMAALNDRYATLVNCSDVVR
ncbi:putative isochorismatase hydrolase [Xenorhabdus bovienii str. Jollieti]|uniref:Putative isochorismatase hydrolase n=1 Tax=Xenorhabdus bovienii (strain SS-2004) TaxID=406818 RepID=D3V767_XENBS|nr:cysteine hydrolase family protein [Xenorhabdus bovienii]CBJ83496.1 putative isochorismatase hydrolase [Xenorhabdus bovienii SS-2004]CDH29246.1 putative isochorismatase hydrolase [Xenorhabdus bovienii str. Jollieti]